MWNQSSLCPNKNNYNGINKIEKQMNDLTKEIIYLRNQLKTEKILQRASRSFELQMAQQSSNSNSNSNFESFHLPNISQSSNIFSMHQYNTNTNLNRNFDNFLNNNNNTLFVDTWKQPIETCNVNNHGLLMQQLKETQQLAQARLVLSNKLQRKVVQLELRLKWSQDLAGRAMTQLKEYQNIFENEVNKVANSIESNENYTIASSVSHLSNLSKTQSLSQSISTSISPFNENEKKSKNIKKNSVSLTVETNDNPFDNDCSDNFPDFDNVFESKIMKYAQNNRHNIVQSSGSTHDSNNKECELKEEESTELLDKCNNNDNCINSIVSINHINHINRRHTIGSYSNVFKFEANRNNRRASTSFLMREKKRQQRRLSLENVPIRAKSIFMQ